MEEQIKELITSHNMEDILLAARLLGVMDKENVLKMFPEQYVKSQMGWDVFVDDRRGFRNERLLYVFKDRVIFIGYIMFSIYFRNYSSLINYASENTDIKLIYFDGTDN